MFNRFIVVYQYNRLFLILLLLQLLLLGCELRTDVAKGVSQRQALQIVALLQSNGINSSATSGEAGRGFLVTVPKEDYGRATAIMVGAGLPSEDEVSIEDLLQSSSFLPQSQLIESLRVDRALGLEVKEHLSELQGVGEVKVMIRSGSRGSIDERGVSIIVFAKEGVEPATIDKSVIEQHVATTFPDLRRDRLTISVVKAQESKVIQIPSSSSVKLVAETVPFLWLWRINPKHYGVAAGVIVMLILSAVVLGFSLGLWWSWFVAPRIRARGGAKEQRVNTVQPPSQPQQLDSASGSNSSKLINGQKR